MTRIYYNISVLLLLADFCLSHWNSIFINSSSMFEAIGAILLNAFMKSKVMFALRIMSWNTKFM